MFSRNINSDNKSFTLSITISCKGKKNFRVWTEEVGKPNSKYSDRVVNVEEKRSIFISFPVSPKKVFIGIANAEAPNDKDFEIQMIETPLRDYDIWIDEQTKEFLQLAISFSQQCGFQQATDNGRLFTNPSGTFNIKYYNVIRDNESGQILNTPARIGHKTGIIEIAKVKYDLYTIPMRMMILLHEFAHKYKNPKIGLKISDEVGADINALYIYLGMGFSKIDAICVYANVFLKAQTQSNIERMRKIMNYIHRFENQDFAKRNN